MNADLDRLSDYFSATGQAQTLGAGSVLFRQEDPINWMYWINEGQARLVRRSLAGQEITLQSIALGLLAEASLYQKHYHCDGLIEQASTGFRVKRKEFGDALLKTPKLHEAFSRYLANNLRETRAISEIKSLKRTSERLDAWIALKGKDSLKRGLLTGIADQIAVSREALYRELSKRTDV